MSKFQIFRETALPGTLQPYALYIVAPTSKPNYIELYATNSTGTQAKRIIQDTDVQALIDASIAGLSSIEIVADIPARDALNPTNNIQVLVLDASADPAVSSGSATYIYRMSTTSWIKISESESMDVILNWDNIVGKPTSTANQIDTAVANSHTHTNKTQLDKVGEDVNGNLTYNGALPVIAWSSVGW